MFLRKIAAGIVVCVFFLGFSCVFPAVAGTAENLTDAAENGTGGLMAEAAVSVEQAIQIAKEAFVIPSDVDYFISELTRGRNNGFTQPINAPFWELSWSSYSSGSLFVTVTVNAVTGDIWGMNRWGSDIQQGAAVYRGLPALSREQAEVRASAFIKRFHPERFQEIKLQDVPNYYQSVTVKERGFVEYFFYYDRYVDGVLCEGDGITVSVNGDTGEITRFDLTWAEGVSFPAASVKLPREKAEEIFRTAAAPELSYLYTPSLDKGGEPAVLPVYLPSRELFVIDALTGEKLTYYEPGITFSSGSSEYYADIVMVYPLADSDPPEDSWISRAGNLLPEDEALRIARSAVTVPSEYVLADAGLKQDPLFEDNLYWVFTWMEPQRAYNSAVIYAAVNAANGEVVEFSTSGYGYRGYHYDYNDDTKADYSLDEARAIVEEYLQKIQPEKWSQVQLSLAQPMPGMVYNAADELEAKAYMFEYIRLVNGLKFPQNGFTVVVNSSTGAIDLYRMNWWDGTFQEPSGVSDREAAADKYLRQYPLELVYKYTWVPAEFGKPLQEQELHLVYQLPYLYEYILDARTGCFINSYDGGAIDGVPAPSNKFFSDLEGHPARAAVELLVQFGVIIPEEGRFRPDETVTQGELIAMLVNAYGQPYIEDTDYYKTAKHYGIFLAEEREAPEAVVDRETLARLLVQTMGVHDMAVHSDYFTLPVLDAREITLQWRGHAAISLALELINPVEGNFAPKAPVTRAEAAEAIVKMLSVK